MIKRVNFTGRRRLTLSCVNVIVHPTTPRAFDAEIDLSETKMPESAAVFLEATSAGSSIVQRFHFGTVGAIEPPEDRRLTDVEGQNVFFHLKVVDQTERVGRLLGVAERIRPEQADKATESGNIGILPIEERDLGQELWKLEFGENAVTLLVNSHALAFKSRLKGDPSLFGVIYPPIIRMVLATATEDSDLDDEDDTRWQVQWLRFGKSKHPERLAPPPIDDPEGVRDWIDAVVEQFCKEHKLRDGYLNAAQDAEEDD